MRTAGDKTSRQRPFGPVDPFADRIRQVRTWAFAHGHLAGADALRVIFEVKAARRGPFDRWTLVDVDELVWHELVSWCQHEEIPLPAHLTETLWTYLGFMWDTGLLHPSSQGAGDLRAPLIAYGGLGPDGRPRTQPKRRRPSSRPRSEPSDDRPGRLAPIIPLDPRRRRDRALLPSGSS